MSVFTKIQRSRVRRTCGNCREPIEAGQRYARHTQTPDDEFNDGTAWRVHVSHVPADCPLTHPRREEASES